MLEIEWNGIGDYGVRHLSRCHWPHLRKLNLGSAIIIKA